MSAKIPTGMVRKTGMFGSTEYEYKGVRVEKGCGRFSSKYDFYIGEHKPSNRINCSTLIEAVKYIDQFLTIQN